jgi:hypothetical protein
VTAYTSKATSATATIPASTYTSVVALPAAAVSTTSMSSHSAIAGLIARL